MVQSVAIALAQVYGFWVFIPLLLLIGAGYSRGVFRYEFIFLRLFHFAYDLLPFCFRLESRLRVDRLGVNPVFRAKPLLF